ncbi:MAG: radical SAM protein [Nanoarchaeota archaeon]|nr:radical SAM protein [Nanoarchaeota archaeon]
MDTLEKAGILGKAGKYDSCGPKMCEVNISQGLGGIYHAKAEHESCRIFKTLMDNRCSFDCRYCANSAGCKKKGASYEPEELANLFSYLNKNHGVNGLFLSSAITGDQDKVTEKMLEAVRLVRHKHGFSGYVHFKVLPGTSYDLIKQASELSSRMSINIESPNKQVLSELSSCKDYKIDILRRQAWVSKMDLASGQTTQMLVNDMSTDKDVLKMAGWEYENMKLKRMYYSAFVPVKGTPLESKKAEKVSKQNHLYNADFLMRDYKFRLKEIIGVMEEGMLPDEDPKLALAKQRESRVDINEAGYEELIRIPGIGPKTARRLLGCKEKLDTYEKLDRFGVNVKRAAPFIKVNGWSQRRLGEFYAPDPAKEATAL